MTIKTVFFDMGGTIDTFWFSPEMRLQETPELGQLLISHGMDLHLSNEQLYQLVTGGLSRYHKWRMHTLDELPAYLVWRDYILADFTGDFPQLETVSDDLMVWIETHYYHRQMRPEIPSVLEAIHSMGMQIGLISNVNSLGQVPLNLEQYGIKHYFNPIVLSSAYGRRKPDPSIFHYAARLSNTPTSECIYIGDRISRDIVGAKRAGYKLAIQIMHDFNHGESDEGAIPDLIINNMRESLDVLRDEIQVNDEDKKLHADQGVIRAVLFDADGILYYRNNKNEMLDSFISQYGSKNCTVPESELDQLRHKAFIGQITFDQYISAFLDVHGINEPRLVSEGIQTIIQEKDQILFFENILATLNVLKSRNLYLGIITDTAQPLHVKISKLERGGIGHLWDIITPSNEVGVQKPDPGIYQLALQQLGIRSNQAVFVGHKSTELEGARNVGMCTVAFNYENGAEADYYIEKFSDLTDLPIIY